MFKSILYLPIFLLFSSDIYQYSLPSIDQDQSFNISSCRGKKILIVNTAANSQYADQYEKLEQLYMKYKESLVVIAVSSNNFGNEISGTESISKIKQCNNLHFILTQSVSVNGDDIHPLYSWLTTKEKNGVMNNEVKDDFKKYLVNESGDLVGVFAPQVDPMSQEVIDAVQR